MLSQIVEIFAAVLLAIGDTWFLISGFDDDDNDGDGTTYPAFLSN